MTETTNRWQQAQAVEREAGRRLKRIMRMENEGAQRALLAKLRKGVDRRRASCRNCGRSCWTICRKICEA